MLGAGGAAHAIALKLAQAGAARIFVCNRTLDKAEALAQKAPAQISACAFDAQTLSDCALFSDLLVNTTPMGMEKVDAQFVDFGFLDSLGKHAPVCDLIISLRRQSSCAKRGSMVIRRSMVLVC